MTLVPRSLRATALALTLPLAACGGDEARSGARAELRDVVAVTSGPAALVATLAVGPDLVERVGGAGAAAADWRPDDAELAALVSARRVVVVGLDLEPWAQRAGLPPSRTVTLGELVPEDLVLETETFVHTHGSGAAHEHGGTIATAWTDPELLRAFVHGGAELLAGVVPEPSGAGERAVERRADFQARVERYADVLGEVRDALAGRTLLATDHGLDYVARFLGIEVAVTLLETERGRPNDAGLRELERLSARSDHAPVVAWLEPIDAELAGRIEQQLGVRSVRFDVGAAAHGEPDTLDTLIASAEALRDALRRP